MLDYQLIRSGRRKTLALQIKHGQVIVRAPHSVSTQFIDEFVQQKSSWLKSKVAEQQSKPDYFDFRHASKLLFLGEDVTLNICTADSNDIFISESAKATSPATRNKLQDVNQGYSKQLNVVIRQSRMTKLTSNEHKAKFVKSQLEAFFKLQAEQLFNDRLEIISRQTSLYPKQVKIRQYKARWGSCNNRAEVSLNYLLMMTPLFVIDYVIVHELCHLKHLNHSKAFWSLVEKHCPNYQQAKKWLVDHQPQLYWQLP